MTDAAAFQACFTDWRLVKGRKCVQVVLELPLEHADRAYQALGGMPDPGKSVWCAVARLKNGETNEAAERGATGPEDNGAAFSDSLPAERLAHARSPQSRSSPRPFTSLPLPQQAALLCQDPVFWAFAEEELGVKPNGEPGTARLMYDRYGINSRAELKPDTPAARLFIQDREHFQAWKLVG